MSWSKPEAEGVPWAEEPPARDPEAGEEAAAAAGDDDAAPTAEDEEPALLEGVEAAAGGEEEEEEEEETPVAAGLLVGVRPPAGLEVALLPLLEEEPLPLDDVAEPEPSIGPL